VTRRRLRHKNKSDAELDITSFLNLMIILVPVLLMSMVFARVTVLELTLPPKSDAQNGSQELSDQLEVVIRDNYLNVNSPFGSRRIEQNGEGAHDYAQLSKLLQNIKVEMRNRGIERDNILILSQPDTDYQTLVSVMDTVRSYKAVVAASVVDAALFPSISLGDAPAREAP
jgi:biopolymer transport protein ExbD